MKYKIYRMWHGSHANNEGFFGVEEIPTQRFFKGRNVEEASKKMDIF